MVFIFCCSVSVDLSVGSSDRHTGGEDFDRTHQVGHLALLGTSPSVSTQFIIFSFLLIAVYFTTDLNFHSDAVCAQIHITCETVKL